MPIGTILPYIGLLANIPSGWALCDGNNGTPNLTGRFLQGWGWDDFYNRSVGQYIQEGLPNIWGYFKGYNAVAGLPSANFVSGAFKIIADSSDLHTTRDGSLDRFYEMEFNAKHCSWLYGNSTTVQPRAYVVMYIMKIQA